MLCRLLALTNRQENAMSKPEVYYVKAQSRMGKNNATVGPSQIYAVTKDNPIKDPFELGDKITFKFYEQHKAIGILEEIDPAPAFELVAAVTEIDPTTPLAVQLTEQGIDHLTLEDIAIYLHSENYIQDL